MGDRVSEYSNSYAEVLKKSGTSYNFRQSEAPEMMVAEKHTYGHKHPNE